MKLIMPNNCMRISDIYEPTLPHQFFAPPEANALREGSNGWYEIRLTRRNKKRPNNPTPNISFFSSGDMFWCT